jgi:crotonobetainyl-CoA:carnitine CoA-transferase CaiB-like acyl-CoA transferase
MPVQNVLDQLADPHLAARKAIVEVEHPETGVEHYVANPIRMSLARLTAASAAPLLGADTRDVLTRDLGIDATVVDKLIAEGVCS